jgi:hypothetical protein
VVADTEWVSDAACRQARSWWQERQDVRAAVAAVAAAESRGESKRSGGSSIANGTGLVLDNGVWTRRFVASHPRQPWDREFAAAEAAAFNG